jgi:hypothetical protein
MHSPAQHHLAEGEIVVDRRDETRRAIGEDGGAGPLTVLHGVVHPQTRALRVFLVARRKPVELVCRHAERGVRHTEGLEDSLPQERPERLARRARDQYTQNVGARVVHPAFAGLVHERQAPHTPHPLLGRVGRRWLRRTDHDLLFLQGPQNRIRVGRAEHQPEAHAEAEQVAYGDGPLRRLGVVERTIEAFEDPAVSEFRQ